MIELEAMSIRAGDTLDGQVVEDTRAIDYDHPMTVGVKVGGEWRELPAEGRYTVDRP